MKRLFNVLLVTGLVLGFIANANACFLGRVLRGGARGVKGAAKVVNTVRPGFIFRK